MKRLKVNSSLGCLRQNMLNKHRMGETKEKTYFLENDVKRILKKQSFQNTKLDKYLRKKIL